MTRYEELKNKINKANYDYYVLDKPSISDFEYDMLLQELIDIEKNNPSIITPDSPSLKIGGEVIKAFKKVKHSQSMLSLNNVYSINDLKNFLEKITSEKKEINFLYELKIDGLAINLTYENGLLIQASTRGDGTFGEDVTENVKTIKDIPLRLNKVISVEVRGEIFLKKSIFERLNQEKLNNGEVAFMNARNAAAGTLRQLDPKVVSKRKLSSFIFHILNPNLFNISTQEESLKFIKDLGFNVNHQYQIGSLASCESIISHFDQIRNTVDYDTDGVVIKVNDFNVQNELGYTAKAPKWAIAYKFSPETAFTKLLDIVWQVGRFGTITPVGILEPIIVAGSNITRATLHNIDNIISKDIKINDFVLVRKAGEIIPEIVEVLKNKRPNNAYFEPIDKCPSCETLLIKQDDLIDLFCPNVQCPARIKNSLIHFVSKNAFNIESLGESTIEILYDFDIIHDFIDIFTLKKHHLDILKIGGFGEKKLNKIYASINKAKNINFENFIFSLGIKHVGFNIAKLLSSKFTSLNELIKASVHDLTQIHDIGVKMAEEITAFFDNYNNKITIENLIKEGVVITYSINNFKSTIFQNTKIVITGSLSVPRGTLIKILESHQATVTNSICKNTDILILGQNAGSKLTKAKELNIKILTENELFAMLNDFE